MNAESYIYKVLSSEKIPPIPRDTVLGIKDNSNHPRFTPTRHENYQVAHSNLLTAVQNLKDAYAELSKTPDIDLTQLKLSIGLSNSYLFIIEEAFHVNTHRAPAPKNGLVGLQS